MASQDVLTEECSTLENEASCLFTFTKSLAGGKLLRGFDSLLSEGEIGEESSATMMSWICSSPLVSPQRQARELQRS